MPLLRNVETKISKEDYLHGELTSELKHELIDGVAYAMAGASTNHNRIVANVVSEFRFALKNTHCEPFASDMKLQVKDNFFYPDSMVVCDHESNESGITDSPLIIVEVLSKSTRQTDNTLKRTAYQQLPSLTEYVIIEQDLVDIEVCQRKNHWQSEHYYLGDEVLFEAINVTLSVAEIYDRVANDDMSIYREKLAEVENQKE